MTPGTYHGSRGSGRANGYNNRNHNNNNNYSSKEQTNNKDKLNIQPHYASQNQTASTFSMIKDHILNEIQKHYKCGFNIAEALQLEVDKGTGVTEPITTTLSHDITSRIPDGY